MSSQNIMINNRNTSNTLNSSSNRPRAVWFRHRWESSRRTGQSVENDPHRIAVNNSMRENVETLNPRNTITSRAINMAQEGSITTRHNQTTIRIDESPLNNFRRMRQRNLGREYNNNLFISIYNNNSKKLNKIEEEEKKKEEICNEENIGSEIKDTVKCYICFDKIFN